MPSQTIGDIIRELRTGIDVTQRELAALMGVSGSAVEAYEQGLRSPNAKGLAMLCHIARVHNQDELTAIFELREMMSREIRSQNFAFCFRG